MCVQIFARVGFRNKRNKLALDATSIDKLPLVSFKWPLLQSFQRDSSF